MQKLIQILPKCKSYSTGPDNILITRIFIYTKFRVKQFGIVAKYFNQEWIEGVLIKNYKKLDT